MSRDGGLLQREKPEPLDNVALRPTYSAAAAAAAAATTTTTAAAATTTTT